MTVVNATSAAQSLNANTGGGRQYTIQHGDTLSGIAQQNGVSLSALRAANPQILNPNVIYAGDRVSIPGGQAGSGNSSAPTQQTGSQPAVPTAASSDGSTRLSMADYQRAASALGVDVATCLNGTSLPARPAAVSTSRTPVSAVPRAAMVPAARTSTCASTRPMHWIRLRR